MHQATSDLHWNEPFVHMKRQSDGILRVVSDGHHGRYKVLLTTIRGGFFYLVSMNKENSFEIYLLYIIRVEIHCNILYKHYISI